MLEDTSNNARGNTHRTLHKQRIAWFFVNHSLIVVEHVLFQTVLCHVCVLLGYALETGSLCIGFSIQWHLIQKQWPQVVPPVNQESQLHNTYFLYGSKLSFL